MNLFTQQEIYIRLQRSTEGPKLQSFIKNLIALAKSLLLPRMLAYLFLKGQNISRRLLNYEKLQNAPHSLFGRSPRKTTINAHDYVILSHGDNAETSTLESLGIDHRM